MGEMILTNARIILADEVIEGSVVVHDGTIAEIDDHPTCAAGAFDLEGDILIPGLVELHTDNIERHIMPRPKAVWPSDAAVLSHDREVAAAGITTVLNALAIGAINTHSVRIEMLEDVCGLVESLSAAGALKASHLLHLRCEVSYPELMELLESLLDNSSVQLISVMDHTPGQRQFVDLEQYSVYYQGKFGLSDDELERFIADRRADQVRYSEPNRRMVVQRAMEQGITLASHDDATREHVDEAIRDGIVIAEFPTTIEAAKASHKAGMDVLMGGPNMVRGASHSGNVSARELAAHGILDILSSDYIPSSLVYAALTMAREVDAIELPQAIATVTRNPARKIGLTDRGEIATGLRADLVRFRPMEGAPVIRDVWRAGEKIA